MHYAVNALGGNTNTQSAGDHKGDLGHCEAPKGDLEHRKESLWTPRDSRDTTKYQICV